MIAKERDLVATDSRLTIRDRSCTGNFFWLMPDDFIRRSGHEMNVSEVSPTAADSRTEGAPPVFAPDLLDVHTQRKISLETL
jgi:hypothetical protein